jgi:hypothetical protein
MSAHDVRNFQELEGMQSISIRMKPAGSIFLGLFAIILAASCGSSQSTPTTEPALTAENTIAITIPTDTPDPCTGWTCEVAGNVYVHSADPGNEEAGISLTLIHHSNCSPTRGQVQTVSNSDGSFRFPEIFFHDTDRVQIMVEQEGFTDWMWDSAGQYCYYCACFDEPIQAVLQSESAP